MGTNFKNRLVPQLRETLGKMEVALSAINEAIAWADSSGRVEWSNAAFDRLVNRPRLAVLGANLVDILPLEKNGHCCSGSDHPAGRVLEGESEVRGCYLFRRATEELNLEVLAVGVKFGHEPSVVITIYDVTELKRAEKALQDRGALLQALNEELEAFSYAVSHDLRSPLRHINGFINLLQKDAASDLDERSRRYMAIISESAKRMGSLIDDLLSFARMGRAEMRRTKVNLDFLVHEVIQNLNSESADRQVEWRITELPEVECDASMMRQVLHNLIANALKFTRHRDKTVIEVRCQESGPGKTVIFVRDNGVGFDMKYVDKLFNVFQRLHRDDEFEGTGIGLANVQRIIHRHGGRTWAEGDVGNGATFYFSLPDSGDEPADGGHD